MNFSVGTQVGARFKLVAHKGDENNPTKETDWFNNLVLDSGLDRLSVGSAITLVAVGTGNSTPVVTQTSLDNVLATTSTAQGPDVALANSTVEPYYFGARRTFRFSEGAAAGNLTEVGVGWTSTNMFNRTLIKNQQGNPTTLTILSDEFLDVIVEIRHYPQRSFTGSFNLLNKLGDTISTHTVNGVCMIDRGSWSLGKVDAGNLSSAIIAYSGLANLSSVTSVPSGTQVSLRTKTSTYPTTRSLRSVHTIGLNEANFNITSFLIPYINLGATYREIYKFEIDPPIPKNNTQIMTITFTLTWDRYTGD